MDRTVQAALLTTLVVGGSLVGLGVFLGFPVAGSTWFGLIVGLLSGALLLAAGRRADSFHPTEDNAHLTDHRPEADADVPSDHPDQRPGA